MVLQITGMQDDIHSCNYFNLHRYTLKWTEAQRTDCILVLLVAAGQKDIVAFKLQVVLVLRSPSSASR